MRLVVCIVATALAGCFTSLPDDGALRCNTQATKVCPSTFYCASDGTCWRNGHAPGIGSSSNDLATSAGDLGIEFDLGGSKACTMDACAGNTLRKCDGTGLFVDTTCALGCLTTGGPHCAVLVPQSPVMTQDLDGAGLTDATIVADTILHGDTGAIDNLRTANASPTVREIRNGIAFHVAGGLAIFSFKSLTVQDGATIHLTGPNPVALVSASDVTVIGTVEARSCVAGGIGGAVPGMPGQSGTGAGAGTAGSQVTTSGGGAGHGDKGGDGATDMAIVGDGAGGGIYDVPSLNPLRGGSSGAGGRESSGGVAGGRGGAGGGAVQIVASGSLLLGGGTQAGGVNAGGCGGVGGTNTSGGGGGGSGGAILIEVGQVIVRNNGGLAANGGGGGSQNGNGAVQYNGADGSLSTMRSSGGSSGGGRGGAASSDKGETGAGVSNGGGGGAVGRIRIETLAGSATLPASYILSPALADINSTGEGLCTQGFITVQ